MNEQTVIPRILDYKLTISLSEEQLNKYDNETTEYNIYVDSSDYEKFMTGQKTLDEAFHYLDDEQLEILKDYYEK